MRRRPRDLDPPKSKVQFADEGFVDLKTVLALLLLGVAVFILSRIAPPYFANAELVDKIRDEAKFAQASERTPDQVRGNILRKALSLEIPLKSENVQIEMDPTGTHITADYVVTVDLYYHQVDWAFHATSDR